MTARRSPPPPPRDPALPSVVRLFDVDARRDWVGAGTDDHTRLRYIEYEPGRSIVATVDVHRGETISTAVVDEYLGANDTVVSRVHWFPHDPGIPTLAARHAALVDQGEVSRLAWVPGRRCVLAAGDEIVKFHESAAAAIESFRRARRLMGVLPTPAAIAMEPDERVVVSRRVVGRALGHDDALSATADAAAILRSLHRSDADGLPTFGAQELLDQARPAIALAQHLRPDRASTITELVAKLERCAPTRLEPVTIHGDFNVGQLVVDTEARTHLVDIDTLAAGPPGLDLGAYGANLVSGRPEDLDDARRATEALADAYVGPVDDLHWYLAAGVSRRLDRPFRRAKRDWPTRIDRSVDALAALVENLER